MIEIGDVLDYTFKHLTHRSLRTWLTMVGIILGIFTITFLIGISNGLRADVSKQMEMFNPRAIVIYPAKLDGNSFTSLQMMPTAGKLRDRDYYALRKVQGIDSISRIILGRGPLKFKKQVITVSISAVEPSSYMEVNDIKLEKGRFLEENDKRLVILGWNIAHELFDDDIKLGSYVYINDLKYKVIGILEKTGNSFVQFDDMIIIIFDEGRDMFSSSLLSDEISAIRLIVSSDSNPNNVGKLVEEILSRLHKVSEDEEDFSVITPDSINEKVNSIINSITFFMLLVAGISILVGSIGISNTMFMSVVERTKEVGLLKSIGAFKSQILILFLVESGLLGLIGGVIGIILSILLSFLISHFGVNSIIDLPLIFLSLLFSCLVGIISGLFPAMSASEIPPMEALRYE